MIDLKDYLSSLVVGINQARMMADLESARIAEIYAKDNLLKTFSIPRFRTPDIELNIPVAIGNLESEPVKDYQPIDNVQFNSATYNVFKDFSKTSSFDRKTSTILRSAIAKETDSLEKRIKADDTQKEAAMESLSKNLAELYLSRVDDNIEIESLQQKIKTELTPRIQKKQLAQHQTKVIVQANELREIKPENIIQIKMKLSEDGMEWHSTANDDGSTNMKLLPE
ncbi:hypothetical protein [Tenacibaculum jejuense]|uniref:Amidase n=1 Tax=Tenacibaculum jejuense TaxID=584609 RepID=A0A238U587_9FLAO|nr:hypothetical protein [Tenacibaculum jejuense]SNR14307.1 Amidase [Tenacibaculum jejuense]